MRIKVRISRTAQDIIDIGRDLVAVKNILGHGNWLPWLEAEFGMTSMTAQRFIQVAENIGTKTNTMLDLPPTVLYALAAPSTSDEPAISSQVETKFNGTRYSDASNPTRS